jgi:hypothetical protein
MSRARRGMSCFARRATARKCSRRMAFLAASVAPVWVRMLITENILATWNSPSTEVRFMTRSSRLCHFPSASCKGRGVALRPVYALKNY